MPSSTQSLGLGVFRFLLVGLFASMVLIGTTLIVALANAWLANGDWNNPRFLAVGAICALIVWLFVAVYHLRRETRSMSFSQAEQFIIKAKTVLDEMGYALAAQHADTLTFRPRFHAYLVGGAIDIVVDKQEARMTGPKVSLDVFRRCFRLLNHVQRVQVYLHDHRKFTDNLLKRVELRLRLRPDQFEVVRKNVIELLEKDADIVCEMNLLVTSGKGIRENTIDVQIRDWLEARGIPVEIHKDLVHFVEVLHPEGTSEPAVPV
jgi:hypothetical protein